MIKTFVKSITLLTFLILSVSYSHASVIRNFQIQIAIDNDFAIFAGSSSGVSELLYQNDADWYNQVDVLSTLDFSLDPGEDTIYVLAMDGGGITGFGGSINGENVMDTNLDVAVSDDISSFLLGYNASDVANASFDARLVDVQSAFTSLVWNTSPTRSSLSNSVSSSSTAVVQDILNLDTRISKEAYIWGVEEAVLYRFNAPQLNIAVPEPSMLGVVAFALFGMRRLSKR
ncbi:hypothetical protein [Alteromonas sp. KUL49]|uniref:hypothetical protein n=1 Tax=Alteromonas sp. KUL49 TaxID=2480798 RepID=UPI00102EEADE|nr:hypothetical protein [Alteromonas sp. KUL49]TAP36871.1 hypothetical protein EYS00_17290 [Alteromonas sp. KUL49]GEA13135.1 hypothetical protein KUL49_35100 [Alteromonas sp. KUL49]